MTHDARYVTYVRPYVDRVMSTAIYAKVGVAGRGGEGGRLMAGGRCLSNPPPPSLLRRRWRRPSRSSPRSRRRPRRRRPPRCGLPACLVGQ